MNKRKLIFAFAVAIFVLSPSMKAQKSIDASTLEQIRHSFKNDASDKAIRNAIGNCDMKLLATNEDNRNTMDTHFTIELKSNGITDQQSSGRCWLFSGLNTLRAKVINKYHLGEFQFSQIYLSFYDQLEKSNLFLQRVIETAKKPMDDKVVNWLFHNPIGDGGTYTGVADLIKKYGVVPREVMHETRSSNSTSQMQNILSLKLREFGLQLRDEVNKGTAAKTIEAKKVEMLKTIYRILALNLGVPPTQFTYTMRNAKGNIIDTADYTPQSFRDKYIDPAAYTDYVMLMNDPTKPYYKSYQLDGDRHVYEGKDWTYVNLPADEIKEMAITSLRDSTMMYFSCDVKKELDSKRGLLDTNNYDYASLMGTTFNMNKKERIISFASSSTHAMCLIGVDLDKAEKPTKWLIENSWGLDSGFKGHLVMTDQWFNEYMFRLVVLRKYATEKVLDILKQKPTLMPPWDPMFAPEE